MMYNVILLYNILTVLTNTYLIAIPTPDSETVWKCVCTLSGHHERPIYSIDW